MHVLHCLPRPSFAAICSHGWSPRSSCCTLLQPDIPLPQMRAPRHEIVQSLLCCGQCIALCLKQACRQRRRVCGSQPVGTLGLMRPPLWNVVYLHCCILADCSLPCLHLWATCTLQRVLLPGLLPARQCVASPLLLAA